MILGRNPVLWLGLAQCLLSLAAISWTLATGQAADVDLLAAISATIGAVVAVVANTQTPIIADGVAYRSYNQE